MFYSRETNDKVMNQSISRHITKLLVRQNNLISVSRFREFSGRKYGQPTEWTHSHIIGKNEVNHGIQKLEFRDRRENIVERLLKQKSSGSHLLIIPAAKKQFMIEKIPYFFRNWVPRSLVSNSFSLQF